MRPGFKQWPSTTSDCRSFPDRTFQLPHTFPLNQIHHMMHQSLTFFLLLHLSIFHLTATSCCCCCDCCCCCCPCCCCCGCGSKNNNALSLGNMNTDDDLTLGNAQPAPTANSPSLGPGLLPDGSTGQTTPRTAATPFMRRRKRGFGKLAESASKCGLSQSYEL